MSKVAKRPVGRPLEVPTPERFTKLAESFFAKCDADKEPYTITGLALAVGLYGRKELCDYERRPEFSHAVKKAKTRVEHFAECRLYDGQAAGPIFALKNFGWSDRQDVNISGHTTSDVRTLGIVTIDDPAQLSKTCEAMRLWQQKRNQLDAIRQPTEKKADAQASQSPLEKLRDGQQPKQQDQPDNPARKQW